MKVHQISADSPDMSDQEVMALRESIASIGQQVPILIWRGDVIDGRKRLAVCQTLGIEPITQTMPDDDDPSEFAHAMNLLRTHYSSSQRAAYAERLATMRRGDRDAQRSPNLEIAPPPTQREAARRFGVSLGAVAQARKVRRSGAPEVIQAVERGVLTLHAAEQIATKVPHEEQPHVVEKVIAAKQGKRNAPSKVINVAAPGLKRAPRRDAQKVRERALRTIHECAAGLDQFMEDPIDQADAASWLEWINTSLEILRRFKRKLETPNVRTA